jgi:hypothetical protein
MIRLALALGSTAALIACSGDEPQDVRAICAREAEALDDAASMIDERRLPPEALGEEADTDTADTPQETPTQ